MSSIVVVVCHSVGYSVKKYDLVDNVKSGRWYVLWAVHGRCLPRFWIFEENAFGSLHTLRDPITYLHIHQIS